MSLRVFACLGIGLLLTVPLAAAAAADLSGEWILTIASTATRSRIECSWLPMAASSPAR